MIRLIASDLDGTLLHNYEQSVSEDILDAIRALKKQGILFVAASGRQYSNVHRLFSPLGYEIPIIAENGSLCIYEGRQLSSGLIPAPIIRRILDGLMEYRRLYDTGHCILSVKDTYYTDSTDERFLNYMTETMRNDITVVPDLYKVEEDFIKAAICDFNGTKHLEEFFGQYLDGEIRAATSAAHWIDFIAPNANKGSALSILLKELDIRPEECICFGDQQNDVEMLKIAGTSYVMESGVPEAKAHADHVVASVVPVLRSLIQN